MKKHWVTITFLAVFVLLLGYTIYVFNKPAENKGKVIFNIDQTKILSVEITSSEKFELKRDDDIYYVLVPEAVPAISNKVESIFEKSSKIEYESIISQDDTNFEKFGLTNPKVIVRINTADGIQKVINIGDNTPSNDGYYMREEAQNIVYKISLDYGVGFMQGINDFIDKNIFTLDKDKIDKVIASLDNQEIIINKVNSEWQFNGKKIDTDKVEQLEEKFKLIQVEGVADKSRYVNYNTLPDVKLITYKSEQEVLNISVYKKDDNTYNIIRKDIPVQYYITSQTYQNSYNDILDFIKEIKVQ